MENGIRKHGGGIVPLINAVKEKKDCGRSEKMVVARKMFQLRKWLNKGCFQLRESWKRKDERY